MTEARDATTVMLLRDLAPCGLEVHLQRRPAEMSFGADAHVFPGGSLDGADAGDDMARVCGEVDLGPVAERMGLDTDDAGTRLCRALHVCALREVFEESGVLLAAPLSGGALGAADAGRLAEARRRLLAGGDLATELTALEVRPRLEELVYAAHFITPLGLPRRYDTRFFCVRAPLEQEAAVHIPEAVTGGWWAPAEMLAMSGRGEVVLMPPTRILLTELARYSGATEALLELGARPVARILFDIRWLSSGAADFDHLPSVEEIAALEATLP